MRVRSGQNSAQRKKSLVFSPTLSRAPIPKFPVAEFGPKIDTDPQIWCKGHTPDFIFLVWVFLN